ncbi:hypothetical protein, partial [Caballeronia choica]|uniref:hypothetical protein n=1 Tax=Caballeronia choica TaxID=326476 RepID=UPI001F2CECDF
LLARQQESLQDFEFLPTVAPRMKVAVPRIPKLSHALPAVGVASNWAMNFGRLTRQPNHTVNVAL